MFQADEKRMKKAVKPIKSLEQHIYVNVLALLAIFVGISTISQSALELDSKASLIGATLVQCASFSVIFLLITHPYFLVSFACAQIRERNLNPYIKSV